MNEYEYSYWTSRLVGRIMMGEVPLLPPSAPRRSGLISRRFRGALTLSGGCAPEAHEAVGDHCRFVGTLDLDGDPHLHLKSAAGLLDRDELYCATPQRADRKRRRKANPVQAVVDSDLCVGDVEQVVADRS